MGSLQRRNPGCRLCASTLPAAAVAHTNRSFLCFQMPVGLQVTAVFNVVCEDSYAPMCSQLDKRLSISRGLLCSSGVATGRSLSPCICTLHVQPRQLCLQCRPGDDGGGWCGGRQRGCRGL